MVCNGQDIFYIVNPLPVEIIIKDAHIKGFDKKPDQFDHEYEYNLYQEHAEPLIGESIGSQHTAISTYVGSIIVEVGQKKFFELRIPPSIAPRTRLFLNKDGKSYLFKSKENTPITLPLQPTKFKESTSLMFPALGLSEDLGTVTPNVGR